jgi:hypothetical protein
LISAYASSDDMASGAAVCCSSTCCFALRLCLIYRLDESGRIDTVRLGEIGPCSAAPIRRSSRQPYEALRLEMTYDAEAKTVSVTIRPMRRASERVRGADWLHDIVGSCPET